MQKTREGFFYRHRDFRIRDLGRFVEQYTVTQSPGVVFIANRECLELDIRKNDGLGDRRVVCVDPLTGLCLRTQEFNGDGSLLGLYEYESLNLSPSFAAELSGGPTVWRPITDSALSAQALSPLWIPEGYAPRATEETVDAMGTQWVRHRFTDGAEPLFLMHDLRPTGSAPTNRLTGNALTRVWVHTVGAWTVVEGRAGDTHLVVLGKRPEADLIAVLGSISR
jgi:negative regulator of sigma E activity